MAHFKTQFDELAKRTPALATGLRKLAANPKFRKGELGCNETYSVLSDRPVDKGVSQKIHETLSSTVTPFVTHGYRSGESVEDQPYPTRGQMGKFNKFMKELRFETTPVTPFSQWVSHKNYKLYIQALKKHISAHGGAMTTVMLDVFQSSYDQESVLTQKASAVMAAKLAAKSGVVIGFETGGAQYQANLMRQFCWLNVLLEGCPPNLASHSLTRSKWLNGLTIKTPAQQAFVFNTIASEIAKHYGWSDAEAEFIPWMPNNFHAGNHPEQDITTRLMLRAKLAVIPNFAWDPRYTDEHFSGWVDRQITLFSEEKKTLIQIRIKNAGQGSDWSADEIVKKVQVIRARFKKCGLEDPIIYIHNHEFNGQAAHIGAEALIRCQAMGYRLLVVDSAPPGTSHNSNLIVSAALKMTPEEKSKLHQYNRGVKTLLDLTRRFNNSPATQIYQNPYSKMAGGTNSSDLADSVKLGIPVHEMSEAI